MYIKNHLISTALYEESPNQNDRPDASDISLIVIHNISLPPGGYGGNEIVDLFLNRLDTGAHAYFETLVGLQVSAHLLIQRTGDLVQFVPFNKRAWHAGASKFKDRSKCNDFSIGIELEGTDNEAFTERQYLTLLDVLSLLYMEYPKCRENGIVGHSDIAPDRKTDPGPYFDWLRLSEHGFHKA